MSDGMSGGSKDATVPEISTNMPASTSPVVTTGTPAA